MSMCRIFSCVVGRGCLLWPVCSLGQTLSAFALLHFVLQGQIFLLLQLSLDFLLLLSSTLWCKGHLLCVCVYVCVCSKRSCRSSSNRSISASLTLLIGASTWITVILNGLPSMISRISLVLLKKSHLIVDASVSYLWHDDNN